MISLQQDWFLLSHLLIDRHLEHFIIFYGLEAEYESPIKLLSGIAPEGGLVPVGEVNTAAAARVEHSDSSSWLAFPVCCVAAAAASPFTTELQEKTGEAMQWKSGREGKGKIEENTA